MLQQPSVRDFPHEITDLLKVRLFAYVPVGQVPPLQIPLVQNRRTIRFVLLEVPIQIRLLSEAAFAQRTLERLLFVVDVPHVSLEVARDAERPLAIATLVGLLPRVRPQMSRQIRGSREDLPAELAGVPVFDFAAGSVREHLWSLGRGRIPHQVERNLRDRRTQHGRTEERVALGIAWGRTGVGQG